MQLKQNICDAASDNTGQHSCCLKLSKGHSYSCCKPAMEMMLDGPQLECINLSLGKPNLEQLIRSHVLDAKGLLLLFSFLMA